MKGSAAISPSLLFGLGVVFSCIGSPVYAANDTLALPSGSTEIVRIAALLTLIALLPSALVCMTAFARTIIVLAMIRHGMGMPETPPNSVLVSLALLLTAFVMAPTLTAIYDVALGPFLEGRMPLETALTSGSEPLRAFMLAEVTDQDLVAVHEISRIPLPDRAQDVGMMQLTLAYMLNELRVAFRIGFLILLPFLLIDLVVTSILLALGMLMAPPTTISLPIKVLMFMLIDGWTLVVTGLAGSFR